MSHLNFILFLVFSYFCNIYCETFYYFAYGSNLSGKRLKINSKSAKFYSPAVLEDHRLDFNKYIESWNGAVATIVEDAGEGVIGALWTLDVKDMPNLDKQEGLDAGWYFAKNVTVTTLKGDKIVARTYKETIDPPKRRACDDLPYERRPSNTYLEVIVFGAVESGLPSDYIGYLMSFPTNGLFATDERRSQLGYPFGPAGDGGDTRIVNMTRALINKNLTV